MRGGEDHSAIGRELQEIGFVPDGLREQGLDGQEHHGERRAVPDLRRVVALAERVGVSLHRLRVFPEGDGLFVHRGHLGRGEVVVQGDFGIHREERSVREAKDQIGPRAVPPRLRFEIAVRREAD